MKYIVTEAMSAVEKITGVKLEYDEISRGEPARVTGLEEDISQIVQEQGLSWADRDSYPGHDMSYISQMAERSGFIWLPSTNNSHNPNEYTRMEDILRAVDVQSKLIENLLNSTIK